jgi:hypothetical protein
MLFINLFIYSSYEFKIINYIKQQYCNYSILFIHTYIHMYKCFPSKMFPLLYICIYTYIYTYIYVYILHKDIHTYIYVYVYINVCIDDYFIFFIPQDSPPFIIYIYICIHICNNEHIYIYVQNIHTYICKHI